MLEHTILGSIARSEGALASRAQAKEALAEGGSTTSTNSDDATPSAFSSGVVSAGAASVNDEGEGRALLQYVLPLAEIAGGDLYSALKSCTQG